MHTTPSALLRRIGQFIPLEPAEIAALGVLEIKQHRLPPRAELSHQQGNSQDIFILQEGWTYCYKLLRDGEKQIIDIQIPGDLIGLRNILLGSSNHHATTLTEVHCAQVSASLMAETFQRLPRLGAAMLWMTSRDETMVVEHRVSIGKRNALVLVAHFVVDLALRLETVGLATKKGFVSPIKNYLLASVLGLNVIQLSRALRQLHEQELLTICDGEFDICDFARLQELAEHRGTWLDQPLPFQNIASTNPEASAVGQPADAAVSRNLLY